MNVNYAKQCSEPVCLLSEFQWFQAFWPLPVGISAHSPTQCLKVHAPGCIIEIFICNL